MNHSFLKSQTSDLCAFCKYDERSHGEAAECESCGRESVCELTDNGTVLKLTDILKTTDKILMCQTCLARDIEIKAELKANEISRADKHNSIIENSKSPSQHMQDIANKLKSELPANPSEYYNSKAVAIVDLKNRIMSDDAIPSDKKLYFFVEQIQMRQQILYKALVEAKGLVTDILTEQHLNYKTVQELAEKLSRDEREKLKIQYADYQPSSKLPKVVKPRMSATDKVIEGIAKMMYAPKINGKVQWEELTEEERKKHFNQAKQYYNQMFKKE